MLRITPILMSMILAVAAVGHVSAQADQPAAEAATVQLAGGASAISETHGNWTVNCQIVNNTKACSSSFQQLDNRNQRVFAVEVSPRGDTVSGNAAMPFGLALQVGVTMSVDDKPVGETRAFSTCIPAGCLVPLTFDAATLTVLDRGKTLRIKGVALDSGQELIFSAPLNGFSGALARTRELLKD